MKNFSKMKDEKLGPLHIILGPETELLLLGPTMSNPFHLHLQPATHGQFAQLFFGDGGSV